MSVWQSFLVATGQTNIEYHENEYRRQVFRQHGQSFVKDFDLGTWRNFREFFNAYKFPWWFVLLPVRVPPSTDGLAFKTVPDLGITLQSIV